MFAKYAFRTLLLYSLNPNFILKNLKNCTLIFTFCFSFWGLRPLDPLSGLCPWSPLGDFRPQTLWPGPVAAVYCRHNDVTVHDYFFLL